MSDPMEPMLKAARAGVPMCGVCGVGADGRCARCGTFHGDRWAGVSPALLPDSGRAIDPEPPRTAFYALGRFRVHFNRAGAAPLVWCVASIDGQWEIAVREVTINGHARTVYAPKSTSDDEDGKPSAWISVDGRLDVLVDGRALISALDGADQQSPG